MSPEQLRGKRADVRTDLFALGTILYEMLAGRRPFAGDTAVEVGHEILTREPAPLGDPALDAIARMCLAKDPAARLCSAADLALMLANLPQPAPSRPRRRWTLALAGGLVGAVTLAWAVRPSLRVAAPPRYTRITFQDRLLGTCRFAPDGRSVLYDQATFREAGRVVISSPGQPEARPLTDPGTTLVAVSAAGDMLLRVRGPDGNAVIARAALAGGVPRVVYDDVDEADFSPDGSEVAIVRRVGGKRQLEYPAGKVLFATMSYIGTPRVSPQGDQVAFRLLDGPAPLADPGGTVEVIERDGRRRTLSRPWSEVSGLAWTPDGREVWVSGRRGAFRSIYALTLDGKERAVPELPGWLRLHDIGRDGRVLLELYDYRWGIAALLPGRSRETILGWYDQFGASRPHARRPAHPVR